MPDLFSPDALARSVHDSLEQAIATVPDGKRGALFVDATTDRVQVLLATKVGEAWTIAGVADYDGHHVRGKVSVAGSW